MRLMRAGRVEAAVGLGADQLEATPSADSDEMSWNEVIELRKLSKWGLVILKRLKLLVCLECHNGLDPSSASGHVKKHNMVSAPQFTMTDAEKRGLQAYVNSFTECMPLLVEKACGRDLSGLPLGIPAISVLGMLQGYGCLVGGCRHCFENVSTMKKHITSVHCISKNKQEKSVHYEDVHLQKLCHNGQAFKVFRTALTERLPSTDGYERFCTKYLTDFHFDDTCSPATEHNRDIPLHLQALGFHTYLGERWLSSAGIKAIRSLAEVPKKGPYSEITELVQLGMEDLALRIRDLPLDFAAVFEKFNQYGFQ